MRTNLYELESRILTCTEDWIIRGVRRFTEGCNYEFFRQPLCNGQYGFISSDDEGNEMPITDSEYGRYFEWK